MELLAVEMSFPVVKLASFMLSSMKKAYDARKQKRRERLQRVEHDVELSVRVEEGECDVECDSTEGALTVVAAELAMKAQQINLFGSRRVPGRAIAGLSQEFATHRREVRGFCNRQVYLLRPWPGEVILSGVLLRARSR